MYSKINLENNKLAHQKIKLGHLKKDSLVSNVSQNDSNNYGLDGINHNKSIHALAREELAESNLQKNLRIPRFEKAIENVNQNLVKKYKNKFLESPQERTLSNNKNGDEGQEDAQSKKLRQAQFELK